MQSDVQAQRPSPHHRFHGIISRQGRVGGKCVRQLGIVQPRRSGDDIPGSARDFGGGLNHVRAQQRRAGGGVEPVLIIPSASALAMAFAVAEEGELTLEPP